MCLVFSGDGNSICPADISWRRIGTLSGRDFKLLWLRPGEGIALQHGPHLAFATGTFLGRHFLSGGWNLSCSHDYRTRTTRATISLVCPVGRAGGGGLWEPDRRIRGRVWLDSTRLGMVWTSGIHFS